MDNIFRALRYRNFRIFFMGQGVSLVGTWMQAIAMSWLVYRLTNSAFMLGVVGFVSQAPLFFLTPFAGLMADRMDRRRILICTQILFMAQALALGVITMTGAVTVWYLIVFGFFLGCVNALDIPARQSFIVEMVEEKELLPNAIALQSFMFNAARLIGPSIAGMIIAVAGEGMCFVINGLSFIPVIGSFFFMKLAARPDAESASDMFESLREGFDHSFGFKPIRYILLLLAAVSLTGTSYIVLLPVFARDVLMGGASTLGFLMASAGVGALAATLYLASRKNVAGLVRMIPIASAIFAAGLIALAFSKTLWLSMACLSVSGFGFMAHTATSNTILQTIVDDDKRGRVMSFYTISFIGMVPIGSLISGTLASRIGSPLTVIIGGVLSLGASAAFARKLPQIVMLVHPIYRKVGIIPEVASGIGEATRLSVPPED
jgi:MFS family permease